MFNIDNKIQAVVAECFNCIYEKNSIHPIDIKKTTPIKNTGKSKIFQQEKYD